jgi:hypothetical protein
MTAIVELGLPHLSATDGEIAAINLENARRGAHGRVSVKRYNRNLLEVVMTLAREVQDLLQVLIAFGVYRQNDVRVRCAEWILPIGGRIFKTVCPESALISAGRSLIVSNSRLVDH